MKLIIDIPEELAKKQWYADKEIWKVIRTVWNGTPIPDNATNGDIIQALFPNIDKRFSNIIDLNLWWKAEYKNKSVIHCNCTDAEIAKSFIEDVEAVKDLLPRAE